MAVLVFDQAALRTIGNHIGGLCVNQSGLVELSAKQTAVLPPTSSNGLVQTLSAPDCI